MPPDLAAQYAKPEAVVTEDLVDQAAATVKAMTSKQVNDALRSRVLSVDGSLDDRSVRLARALATEAAEQDWTAANGGPS
jgi:hypothetical protein